jgi:nucleotide-binding universal stress UspA family protein
MVRHLLVPLDGSDPSWEALDHVVETEPDATVTVLHVIDPARASYGASVGIPTSSEEWYHAEEEAAEEMFEEARERIADTDIELHEETVVGQPSRVIVDYVESEDKEGEEAASARSVIDAIVIGSHGRQGVARVLLGSVAEVVVRRSPVPVTVVR